ncbi:hypothetical protein NE463_20170, partial [Anaerotruncus colihominis]|nr:hypothetical protein [Anaerotruncus colihominis]
LRSVDHIRYYGDAWRRDQHARRFVGTLLITMLPEWLKPLQEYIRLFYCLGVMLLMVFMPMGLAGLYRKIAGQVRERLHLGYKTRIGAGGQAEV